VQGGGDALAGGESSAIKPSSINDGITPFFEGCLDLGHGFVVQHLRVAKHADGKAKGIAKSIGQGVRGDKFEVSHGS
jgi:hypothetical protein